MWYWDLFILVLGGTGVWLGAEWLVKGSVRLAGYLGVPKVIIGLTVVAFGTSAPEWIVSMLSAARGYNQIALGNVIGSNVINIGLVLGLAAALGSLGRSHAVMKREIPWLWLSAGVFVLMSFHQGALSRIDGAILLVMMAVYLWTGMRQAMKERLSLTLAPGWKQEELHTKDIVLLIAGLALLLVGAEGMVRGAAGLARAAGVSERVIAVTLVAFGTSVPELAASVVAAARQEGEMAVGNVVGSNIFNNLLVLGTAAAIHPINTDINELWLELIFFGILTLSVAPFLKRGKSVGRYYGFILLAVYALFDVLLLCCAR